MSVSLYDIAVPSYKKHLHALEGILEKAVAYAAAKKFKPETLLTARLFPDMFDLTKQIQACSDFAKSSCARLAQVDVPSMPDNEATIPELQERMNKTIAFLNTLRAAQFEGAEGRSISIKVGPNDMTFTGQEYLLHFALPNFYFHAATAYGILRHNGLEIGKRDFMRRT